MDVTPLHDPTHFLDLDGTALRRKALIVSALSGIVIGVSVSQLVWTAYGDSSRMVFNRVVVTPMGPE